MMIRELAQRLAKRKPGMTTKRIQTRNSYLAQAAALKVATRKTASIRTIASIDKPDAKVPTQTTRVHSNNTTYLVKTTNLYKTPSRNIVNIRDLKGSYNAVAPKTYLSPLNGAAWSYTGGLKRFYEIAVAETKASSTNQLVKSLFYKQNEEFRATQHKSYPAYSLSPALLAQIINFISDESIQTLEYRQKICFEWRKHHLNVTNSRMSFDKINNLLDIIILSKKESLDKQYPHYFTETLLVSFLYKKATSQQELQQYLEELHNLNLIPKPKKKYGFSYFR